ncbi:S-adenosyl-L-methionine-dependent methyltransferase [Fusarium solani]|uniref:S-adenosyl-L-methionine-dependent methyltransferase n=1 Tax=Fusarium solani TaxID=169388 RepID=A0A9P9HZI6_FUSSL|nr:S-adenosyl-L-methionine-dependent methyltransferase [Fusarium solani]KAH7266375.1 S-adenosyl-L-methionine-dependent methyltransferase [Fusarium solani]
MPRRPAQSSNRENMPASSPSSFNHFQFTFNCSASNSGKNSFIEPDPDAQDIILRDSESLTDSVQNFPEEFGRTYHAYRAGSYAFPNDQLERERLDLQNEALVKLFGGRLFFAPLSRTTPPRSILDIATGTGDWAIKLGDLFPQTEVVATDLSPIQPRNVPPNVSFYVEDSSEPWDYSQPFDYIHTRVTSGCWSNFKEQIADQAFQSLTPGGWFESQEFDATVNCDDNTLDANGHLATWFREIKEASAIMGRPVDVAENVREAYERAGFVDVQERVFKMPMNGWPKDERLKEIGRMWERNFLMGLSGFSFTLFNRVYQRTPAQIEVSLVDVRRELIDTRIHAWIPIHVVIGRKPFPGEGPIPQMSFS